MARIEPRTFTLEDGTQLLIRTGEEDDAQVMLAYLDDLDGTTDHTVTMPDERDIDEPKERAWLRERLDNPGELALLALIDGQLVGELDVRCAANRRVIRHHAMLGISVRDGWRGRGIGSALMITLIDWAADHPFIEQLRLGVFADNHGALRLYEALGFVREGVRVRAFRRDSGDYVDDILMYRDVKDRQGVALPAT